MSLVGKVVYHLLLDVFPNISESRHKVGSVWWTTLGFSGTLSVWSVSDWQCAFFHQALLEKSTCSLRHSSSIGSFKSALRIHVCVSVSEWASEWVSVCVLACYQHFTVLGLNKRLCPIRIFGAKYSVVCLIKYCVETNSQYKWTLPTCTALNDLHFISRSKRRQMTVNTFQRKLWKETFTRKRKHPERGR